MSKALCRMAPLPGIPERTFYLSDRAPETGARFVTDMFTDELRTEMKHVGIQSVAAASEITVHHPGAWRVA